MFRRKHWKHITFSVPIQKEVARICKNEEEIKKTISYRLQFIDSASFMASSVSSLVNNLPEGIHKIKCKYKDVDKNVKLAESNINIDTTFLNTQTLKMI